MQLAGARRDRTRPRHVAALRLGVAACLTLGAVVPSVLRPPAPPPPLAVPLPPAQAPADDGAASDAVAGEVLAASGSAVAASLASDFVDRYRVVVTDGHGTAPGDATDPAIPPDATVITQAPTPAPTDGTATPTRDGAGDAEPGGAVADDPTTGLPHQDDVPPTWEVTATLAGATSGGTTTAELPYRAIATDAGGLHSATCADPSGTAWPTGDQVGIFPLGTTVLRCAARDLAGNTATASITVTVTDGSPPSLQLPDAIELPMSSAQGAPVVFTVTADDEAGPVGLTCSHASGDTFAVGETEVACEARDTAGNRTGGSFTVTVLGGTEALPGLGAWIEGQGYASNVERGLLGTLRQAEDEKHSCDRLARFRQDVADHVERDRIPAADGDHLDAFAAAVAESLGC